MEMVDFTPPELPPLVQRFVNSIEECYSQICNEDASVPFGQFFWMQEDAEEKIFGLSFVPQSSAAPHQPYSMVIMYLGGSALNFMITHEQDNELTNAFGTIVPEDDIEEPFDLPLYEGDADRIFNQFMEQQPSMLYVRDGIKMLVGGKPHYS